MSNKFGDLNDLLSIFEDSITTADIISAKCLANISAAIVKKRIELNLSQKDFADLLGVSQGMVSKWESNDYNFTIKTIADIAAKLDMNVHVELTDESHGNSQYISNNTYNCVSSRPAEFKQQKVISFSQYKDNIYNQKDNPKEM